MGCCGSCFNQDSDLDSGRNSNQGILSYLPSNQSDLQLKLSNDQKGKLMSVLKPLPTILHGVYQGSSEDDADVANANTVPKKLKRPRPPPLDPKILVPMRLALIPVQQNNPPQQGINLNDKTSHTITTRDASVRIPLGIVNLSKPLACNMETYLSPTTGGRVTNLQITKPSRSAVSPDGNDNIPIMLKILRTKHEATETDHEGGIADMEDSDNSSTDSSEDNNNVSNRGPNRFKFVPKNRKDNRKTELLDCTTQVFTEDEAEESSVNPVKRKVKKRLSRRERARRQQEYCTMLAQPRNLPLTDVPTLYPSQIDPSFTIRNSSQSRSGPGARRKSHVKPSKNLYTIFQPLDETTSNIRRVQQTHKKMKISSLPLPRKSSSESSTNTDTDDNVRNSKNERFKRSGAANKNQKRNIK